jgi:hypothetical protein
MKFDMPHRSNVVILSAAKDLSDGTEMLRGRSQGVPLWDDRTGFDRDTSLSSRVKCSD